MRRFLLLYPFLSAGTVQALLALAVALGLHLTAVQTGAVEAAAAAILALWVARAARPVPVPLLTGALTAIGALLVAFRVSHVTSGEVSAAVAFLAAVLSGVGHLAATPALTLREQAKRRAAPQESRM